jgi:hypothetical protein
VAAACKARLSSCWVEAEVMWLALFEGEGDAKEHRVFPMSTHTCDVLEGNDMYLFELGGSLSQSLLHGVHGIGD